MFAAAADAFAEEAAAGAVVRLAQHGGRVACLTPSSLELYAAGPRLALSARCEGDAGGFRGACDLAWHPDGAFGATSVAKP